MKLCKAIARQAVREFYSEEERRLRVYGPRARRTPPWEMHNHPGKKKHRSAA